MFKPTMLVTSVAFAITGSATVCSNVAILPQTSCERGACSNNTYLTVAAAYSYRVSTPLICNDTTSAQNPPDTCPGDTCLPHITNGTVIDQSGIANVSLSANSQAAAFSLISETAGIPFPVNGSTTMGAPGAEGYNACVSPTWAGYLSFTPLLNCVNGVFSGCGNGDSDLMDGEVVRLCAPLSNGDQLAGAIFFEQTTDDVANSLGPVPVPDVPEEDVGIGAAPGGEYVTPSPVPPAMAATMVPR